MADGTKAPKGALIAGLVLMVLAVAGCGYGCVSFVGMLGDVSSAIQSAESMPMNSPTMLQASGDAALLLTSDSSALCAVADPAGNDITIRRPGAGTSGRLEVNGQTLELTYYFETTSGTTYDVVCGDEAGVTSGTYAVASIPSLAGVGGIFAGGASGVGFFFVGLILLIVGLVKRSKWRKNHSVSPGGPIQPSGGYGASLPPAPGVAFGQAAVPPAPAAQGSPPPPPLPLGTPSPLGTPPPAPGTPPPAPGTPPPPGYGAPPPAPGAPPPPPGGVG